MYFISIFLIILAIIWTIIWIIFALYGIRYFLAGELWFNKKMAKGKIVTSSDSQGEEWTSIYILDNKNKKVQGKYHKLNRHVYIFKNQSFNIKFDTVYDLDKWIKNFQDLEKMKLSWLIKEMKKIN